MRFYGFGNYYISSLQQGLQSAHVVGELFTQFERDSNEDKMVYDWGKNHKTMVLLNGGNSLNLQELFDFFGELRKQGMYLPFAKFHEDEQSLGGALTYVGMIVPERHYEAAAAIRSLRLDEVTQYYEANEFAEWEIQLVERMNMYRLAS